MFAKCKGLDFLKMKIGDRLLPIFLLKNGIIEYNKIKRLRNKQNGKKMKILQVIGKKNSGKTTVMVDFIESARELGLEVATFKQGHRSSDAMDKVGTDTYRFAAAGSSQVGMQTPNGFFWHETRPAISLKDEISRFVRPSTDLFLIEGFRNDVAYPVLVLLRENHELADFPELSCVDFVGTIYDERWSDAEKRHLSTGQEVLDLTSTEKRKNWLKAWWESE